MRHLTRLLSRLITVASFVIGALVMLLSLIVDGPTINTGLVVGFILVLNGAIRLFPVEED